MSTGPAAFTAAADALAQRALAVLADGGGTAFLTTGGVTSEDAAAIRILGPDVFAPAMVTARPLHAGDSTVLQALFPANGPDTGPDTGPEEQHRGGPPAVQWRDWAVHCLLRSGTHPACPRLPDEFSSLRGTAWQGWAQQVAQVAPLALPGLDSPLHEAVRAEPLSLARGTVRSMLRKDFAQAARLVRWCAWAEHQQISLPLQSRPVIDHILLFGSPGPRTRLDLAVAGHLTDKAAA